MSKMLKVLAIDGGGIRGVIPAAVLEQIEKRTGKKAAELFDLIAGTSTGGILALGLVKPDATGKPQFTAAELSELYEHEGQRIFHHPRKLPGILLEEKYSAKGLEDVLTEYFGHAKLSQAVTETLVTSYELEKRSPWFFARHKALADPAGFDFEMRFVARATSAAPTYFEPEELNRISPPGGFVDGGVFANNPAMCAFVETKDLQLQTEQALKENTKPPAGGRFDPAIEDILLVSLGTGQHTRPIHYEDAKGWGLIHWAKPILDVVFDGVSDTVDHQLSILCRRSENEDPRYFRFQRELKIASDDMDDASPANITKLKQEAEKLLEEEKNAANLETLCRLLRIEAAVPA